MSASNPQSLRVGIDATLAGIKESERGGVYQYLTQILRHGISQSHHIDWKLLFALPHPRHQNTINEFVEALGSQNIKPCKGWVPMRVWRRIPLPVETFTGSMDVFHSPAHLSLPSICPSVVTIHDLAYQQDCGGDTPDKTLNDHERRQWQIRRRFFDEIAAQTERSVAKASKVITVSEFTRLALLKAFQLAPDKVIAIPLGVRDICHQTIDTLQSKKILSQYNLAQPYLLYLGGLDPNKNLVNLIEGFAAYRQQGGRSQLAIAGQSAFYRTVLERLATQLGIQNACSFLGFVPDNTLPALYRQAQAVIMPSPLEGFGLPALEAMACGTPVIAANAGALPEVVGQAAILVNAQSPQAFAEAMMTIQDDHGIASQLTSAGLVQASKFDWRQTAAKTLAVYAQVAGKNAESFVNAAMGRV